MVHEHDVNRGYGGNQKTCYWLALASDADIVVMVHPDYQYDTRPIPFMTGLIEKGVCGADDARPAPDARTRRG